MATFFKDVFSVGLSRILIIVFGLLTSIIIARTLGPEKNGIIAALLVYPTLFMSFGSMGIGQSSTYFLGKGIIDETTLSRATAHIWVLTSLVGVVSCFFIIYYFSNASSDIYLILLVLAPIPFSLFNAYSSGIFLGKNQIGLFNRISWVPYSITTLLVFILIVLFQFDLKGVFIALIAGPLFIFLVLFINNNFYSYFFQSINWGIIRKMLSLGSVYALATLVISLNYKIDIIILDKMSTPYEVGIYSKGMVISQYLWQIPSLFYIVVFARSANSKDEMKFSIKITQLLRLSLVAIGLGCIALIVLSNLIIYVFYGEAFMDSVSVLRILLPGVLILTFYKVLNTDLIGRGNPWVSIKAMAPALVVNIVLNIWLIPEYGADGASFASTASYSFAGMVFIHFYSKEVLIPIKKILNFKRKDFDPIVQVIRQFINKSKS